jgi:hypothetical protein
MKIMGNKSVCLNCYVSYNNGINYYVNDIYLRICPLCGHEMKDLTNKFKPPKKDDIKKWETVKYLIEHGFYFTHIYDYENNKMAKYPENIKDAKLFVEKYGGQKIRIFKLFDIIKKGHNTMDVEIIKELQEIPLWQILNEKEKFKIIIEQMKIFNKSNKIKEIIVKQRKEYNGLNKRLKSIIKYFNKDEQENIMEIINIIK